MGLSTHVSFTCSGKAQWGTAPRPQQELFPSHLTEPSSADTAKWRPSVHQIQWGFILKGGEHSGKSLRSPPMTYQGFAGLGPGWVLQKKNTPDAVCAKCFCLAWVTYDFLPFRPFKSGKVCSESYYNLSTTCKTSADHQLSPNSTGACKKQGEGKENQYINSLVLNS